MKCITKSLLWERVLSVRIIIPLRGHIWAFSELSKRSHVQANYTTLFFFFFFFSCLVEISSWFSHLCKAPHSSTLAWKIPWMEEPGRLQSMGSRTVGLYWVTSLSLFTFMHWRRKWQPTPVFLPGESQGWGSLVGCHLWGCTESDTTEVT